jgi:hypothetical protein
MPAPSPARIKKDLAVGYRLAKLSGVKEEDGVWPLVKQYKLSSIS